MGSPTLPRGPEDPDQPHEPIPHRPPVFVYRPLPPQSAWKRWGRNLLLFVLTAGSVYLTGGTGMVIGLLAILLAHEMGHYLACVYYRVDATLPFFIPAPFTLAGTLGAFIRIRSPIPHRRALFDIGVAGPLAGFVVCLPVLWLGMTEAQITPIDPDTFGIYLGEPLLFQWFSTLAHGPIPEGSTLSIGPLGLAAWFGLFVTALNLIPVGQLDGGHVTYALLLDRSHQISRVSWWICVGLIYFGPNWILWAILLRFLGRRHPPTMNDALPAGRGRMLVGVVSLLVFVVCFVPNPIVFSWTDFFEAVGLAEYLPG